MYCCDNTSDSSDSTPQHTLPSTPSIQESLEESTILYQINMKKYVENRYEQEKNNLQNEFEKQKAVLDNTFVILQRELFIKYHTKPLELTGLDMLRIFANKPQ